MSDTHDSRVPLPAKLFGLKYGAEVTSRAGITAVSTMLSQAVYDCLDDPASKLPDNALHRAGQSLALNSMATDAEVAQFWKDLECIDLPNSTDRKAVFEWLLDFSLAAKNAYDQAESGKIAVAKAAAVQRTK